MALSLTSTSALTWATVDTTVDAEFRFVSRVLSDVPPGSRVLYVHPELAFDVGMRPAPYVNVDIEWVRMTDDTQLPPPRARSDHAHPETFYYHMGACSAVNDPRPPTAALANQDTCRRVRARFAGPAVAEAQLPALPMGWEEYTTDPVLVGLYQVILDDPADP